MGAHVVLAIGTRPELIKLAPVARALAAEGLRTTLLLSGQHPALDLGGAGLTDVPTVRLAAALDGLQPLAAVDAIARAACPVLAELAPDAVAVQGDTSTALACARAAAARRTPVAHVEAGLRSGDPRMPWPEEPFRVEIDRLSQWLFAPTESAGANLENEAVAGAIHVTGNTGIDALREAVGAQGPVSRAGPPLLLVTVHRRENLGDGMARIAAGLRDAARLAEFRALVLAHPRADTAALQSRLFSVAANTRVLPPQTPATTIRLMRRADMILSDSGGMSEEAVTLGRPLLILRDRTERPEAVTCGGATLVGTDPERIAVSIAELLHDRASHAARAQPRPVFGDGHAAPRIAKLLAAALSAGSAMARLDASGCAA